jgi:hypothetical protein
MKFVQVGGLRKEFAILAASRDCQAAKMVSQPGGVTADQPSNEHRQSEQWLFVTAGKWGSDH